jgi:hypothetical protein
MLKHLSAFGDNSSFVNEMATDISFESRLRSTLLVTHHKVENRAISVLQAVESLDIGRGAILENLNLQTITTSRLICNYGTNTVNFLREGILRNC